MNERVVCPGLSYIVLEIHDGSFLVEHSCELPLHYRKLSIPADTFIGLRPRVGEEISISARLTLATKEKRRKRRQLESAGL